MASVLDAPRLSRLIEECRVKCEAVAPDDLIQLDKDMAVDFDEHFSYQNLQAEAHVTGRLTPEAAQIIYVALGEVGSADNGGWAKGTDTATKVIITQLMGELLRLKVAARMSFSG